MNQKTIEIQEDDLHAYVDKQLPADKIKAVEALIRQNPEIALKVQLWQQQNNTITTHFEKKQFNDIPEQLNIKKIQSNLHNKSTQKQPWHYTVAASALILISGSLGWFSHEISQQNKEKHLNSASFASSAISAHQVFSVEMLHPVEVGAEQKEHLVSWLSKRINHQLKIPQLQSYGFNLLGGRLLSMQEGRPAAQLMFENKEGQRITWMISKNPSYLDHTFLSKNEDNINSFYWMDAKVAYSVTSELSHNLLRKLSQGIYQQINKTPSKQVAGL